RSSSRRLTARLNAIVRWHRVLGLVRKSIESAARAVHVYVSEAAMIVAATHRNPAGVYFEQANATFIAGTPSAEVLGREFQAAFQRFSMMEANLRSLKKEDWPAFQASGSRSVTQFESAFRVVSCCSVNASNTVVRASTPHGQNPEIELSVSFNPLLPAEAIGARLLGLVKAANAT
uniref:hypothetical protein n=1 Tax=Pelomonas sp. KK5 TaxID=1855730 RepID=UPI001E3FD2CA